MFTVSAILRASIFYGYIADTSRDAMRTGVDDITSFFGPSKLQVCWIYAILKVSFCCRFMPGYSKFQVIRKLTVQFGTDLHVV